MTNKLKTAIVGCGNISASHLAALSQIQDLTTLVAICDADGAKAAATAKQHSINSYNDLEQMLVAESPDVLHICTPHFLHAPMAITAMGHGVNVLTEKPMSIKLEDAAKMIACAKDNKVTLGVIFQNHYNEGSILIKNTLDSGKLGKILAGKLFVTWHRDKDYYAKSDWRGRVEKEGGGVVINQSIHTFDLMRWFVGKPVVSVDATTENRFHPYIEVEDMAEGIIRFESGVCASFYVNNFYAYNAPVEIELACEHGIAKMIGADATITLNDGSVIKSKTAAKSASNGIIPDYWGNSHNLQIKNYYESLIKGVAPDITGEYAYLTQKMVCDLYDSAAKRKLAVR